MKEKKSVSTRIKETWQKNKTKIIVVGSVIVVVGAAILVKKNWDQIYDYISKKDVAKLLRGIEEANEFVILSVSEATEDTATILSVSEAIEETVTTISTVRDVTNVCKHPRTLPNGWKASLEKLATATENGFLLEPNQTWVDNYTKGIA